MQRNEIEALLITLDKKIDYYGFRNVFLDLQKIIPKEMATRFSNEETHENFKFYLEQSKNLKNRETIIENLERILQKFVEPIIISNQKYQKYKFLKEILQKFKDLLLAHPQAANSKSGKKITDSKRANSEEADTKKKSNIKKVKKTSTRIEDKTSQEIIDSPASVDLFTLSSLPTNINNNTNVRQLNSNQPTEIQEPLQWENFELENNNFTPKPLEQVGDSDNRQTFSDEYVAWNTQLQQHLSEGQPTFRAAQNELVQPIEILPEPIPGQTLELDKIIFTPKPLEWVVDGDNRRVFSDEYVFLNTKLKQPISGGQPTLIRSAQQELLQLQIEIAQHHFNLQIPQGRSESKPILETKAPNTSTSPFYSQGIPSPLLFSQPTFPHENRPKTKRPIIKASSTLSSEDKNPVAWLRLHLVNQELNRWQYSLTNIILWLQDPVLLAYLDSRKNWLPEVETIYKKIVFNLLKIFSIKNPGSEVILNFIVDGNYIKSFLKNNPLHPNRAVLENHLKSLLNKEQGLIFGNH